MKQITATDETTHNMEDVTNGISHTLKFRNYTPFDEDLKKYKLERPSVPSIAKEITESLQKIAKEQPDWNTLSIAPKSANWDLKRDVEKKLEKLEQRTQRAIVEMMRVKLQQTVGDVKSIKEKEQDLSKQMSISMSKDVEDSDED